MGGEDGVKVGLHLLIVRPLLACGDELRDLVLELGDADDDAPQVLDHEALPDHSDIVSYGFNGGFPAKVNGPCEPSPSFDTHGRVRLLEDGLGFAADAVREEAPNCAVESRRVVRLVAVAAPGCQAASDGRAETCLGDGLCLPLSPL